MPGVSTSSAMIERPKKMAEPIIEPTTSAVVAAYGLKGGLSVPLLLALATAIWVWTLPETRRRDLARIARPQAQV